MRSYIQIPIYRFGLNDWTQAPLALSVFGNPHKGLRRSLKAKVYF